MRHLHVLNLGAGVQSTTLLLLADSYKILFEGLPVVFDYAIFADTQEEPVDEGFSVYEHLEWLRQNTRIPILSGSAGRLGDHLMNGTNSTGGRFASIPAFTLSGDGKVGKVSRQCTNEYKIQVVEKVIRREVLGLAPRKHIPKDVLVHQHMGISVDEAGRMLKAKKRQEERPTRWARFHYPLIEQLSWTRADCREYLKPIVPHRVPRSACVFCPFHDDEEWASIKSRGGKDWARVVEVDRELRIPGNVVNRGLDHQLFLHRSCKPIDEVDFKASKGERSMAGECCGVCGT